MKKHFTDEKTGISYTLHGDYYLPDFALPDATEKRHIGIYGKRHEHYLKNHKKSVYMELLFSGRLNAYLADIDEQVREQLDLLVRQLAENESITEKLKEENPMEWVGRMNNIKSRAEEVVLKEMIYN